MGRCRAVRPWIAAAWVGALGCSAGDAAPESPARDGPTASPATPSAVESLSGRWYLDADDGRRVLDVQLLADGDYEGSLELESDPTARAPIDALRWDESTTPRTLVFHAALPAGHEWYRVVPVEGVLVGRFARSLAGSEPERLTDYGSHVTGWSERVFPISNGPVVWELDLAGRHRARLRIDVDGDGKAIGRIKIYADRRNDSAGVAKWSGLGEQPEYDLTIDAWDGANLRFRRALPGGGSEAFTSLAHGRLLRGFFGAGALPFTGERAEVLSYGIGGGKDMARARAYRQRTRAQLSALLLAHDPKVIESRVRVSEALPPLPFDERRNVRKDICGVGVPCNRDDDPATLGDANYVRYEHDWTFAFDSAFDGSRLERKVHGYVTQPAVAAPPSGYPLVVALNGHGGPWSTDAQGNITWQGGGPRSAYEMLDPSHHTTWYGDAFARRGFVVAAIDISHRDSNDDPYHGSGPHPAIAAPGFDSDWEQDGERTYGVLRVIDDLLRRPDIDRERVYVIGNSLGAEVATLAGALDTRVAQVVLAGFAPDLPLLAVLGSHGCWRWAHADILEYVDHADLQALIAPRGLIVQTGKLDALASALPQPFAVDKQVARRARVAWADAGAASRYVHYLHYDGHKFHVGRASFDMPALGVQVPVTIEPAGPDDLAWQSDGHTKRIAEDLFTLMASADADR